VKVITSRDKIIVLEGRYIDATLNDQGEEEEGQVNKQAGKKV